MTQLELPQLKSPWHGGVDELDCDQQERLRPERESRLEGSGLVRGQLASPVGGGSTESNSESNSNTTEDTGSTEDRERTSQGDTVRDDTVLGEQEEILQALRGALRRLESGRRRNAVRDHARRVAKQAARTQQTSRGTPTASRTRLTSRRLANLVADVNLVADANSVTDANSVEELTAVDGAIASDLSAVEAAGEPPLLEGWLCSSGWPELDAVLPERGWLRGSLIEWFSPGAGSGARLLALLAAGQACRLHHGVDSEAAWNAPRKTTPQTKCSEGVLVVLDRRRVFYPPAVLRWGLSPEQLVVLQPDNAADERWALDQVLRSSGVAAVWAEVESIDERTFRRYQLAAESSGVLGMLLRPAWCRQRPSWADLQLWVEPQPATYSNVNAKREPSAVEFSDEVQRWQWRIELMRCRGGGGGRSVTVTLDEQTGRFISDRPSHVARDRHRARAQQLDRRDASSRWFGADREQRDFQHEVGPWRDTSLPVHAATVNAARMINPLEISDGSSQLPRALHLATQLADPKVGRRSARA